MLTITLQIGDVTAAIALTDGLITVTCDELDILPRHYVETRALPMWTDLQLHQTHIYGVDDLDANGLTVAVEHLAEDITPYLDRISLGGELPINILSALPGRVASILNGFSHGIR